MGFSLSFMRIQNNDLVDANRAQVADFLVARGVHIVASGNSGEFFDTADRPLCFNGHYSDIFLDPLNSKEPLSGGIFHATLAEEELEFIFELCTAAGFMIINPQGAPMSVVPNNNHAVGDVPEPNDTAWVQNATELAQALNGSFADFTDYKRNVLTEYQQEPPPQTVN